MVHLCLVLHFGSVVRSQNVDKMIMLLQMFVIFHTCVGKATDLLIFP